MKGEFMKLDELKKIAEENDYKITKSPGYYKFTREHRENYVIYKCGNIKQIWGQFPSLCDDKDSKMKKATFEFGHKEIE